MKRMLTVLCFGGFFVALATVTNAYPQQQQNPQQDAASHQQDALNHQQNAARTPQEIVTEWCHSGNGSVPYWLDPTCKTYVTCAQLNLTLDTCPDGLTYSFRQRACVEGEEVNCTEQNEEFIALLRKAVASSFYHSLPKARLPLRAAASVGDGDDDDDDDDDTEGQNSSNVPSGRAAAGGFGAAADDGDDGVQDNAVLTVDLSDLPTIIVDNANSVNVTLPAAMCSHLGDSVLQLEQSVNTVLLMLTGCPERACDVPLFHFDC